MTTPLARDVYVTATQTCPLKAVGFAPTGLCLGVSFHAPSGEPPHLSTTCTRNRHPQSALVSYGCAPRHPHPFAPSSCHQRSSSLIGRLPFFLPNHSHASD